MARKKALSAKASKQTGSNTLPTEKAAMELNGGKRRAPKAPSKVDVISSKVSYEGPLFRVYTDEILENGRKVSRDVVRHNGSVVDPRDRR